MERVELSAGPIEYEDTGGDGPVVVLVHGLIQGASLWRKVVPRLAPAHRCVVPTWPLGGHRLPMRPGADLSLHGQARLLAEFLDTLELSDVTLVQNDWGGALVLAADGPTDRLARLVLTSCEAFENYPPGLPGRFARLSFRLPGGGWAAAQALRLRPLRRLPLTFGWMSKRPVPDEVMDGWFRPLARDARIRRDLLGYLRPFDRDDLVRCEPGLRAFDRPVLVVWTPEDRVMPPEHGARLAALFPDARLVEIADSWTLIPEDQPEALADAITTFVAET